MTHVGGENGLWKASCSTGDNHSQMNLKKYEKWLEKKLIPNSLNSY
jgi:hypothetical protein